MLGLGRMVLRQAHEALHKGRLEEAQRLLGQSAVQGHKKLWELQQQLGRAFAQRGLTHLRREDRTAAWSDLLLAEQHFAEEPSVIELRETLTRLGMTEIGVLLVAGEPGRALEVVGQLRDRAVRHPDLEPLEEAMRHWVRARELAGVGEFAQALGRVEQAQRLIPNPPSSLQRFRDELLERQETFPDLLIQLHEKAEKGRWREVLQLADQVLALAPRHFEARKAKTRAWNMLEPPTAPSPAAALAEAEPVAPPREETAARFWLWIDGVGGYLVCLGNRVSIGQASPDNYVDVPFYADLSRQHAVLTRDSEGYSLEALKGVQVNGKDVTKTLLQPNDRVTLGSSCQFQFRQPVPVSTSARLDLVSGHRLKQPVEAVLLMADTLILGPGSQVHVAMPDLKHPLILYRHKNGVGVRHVGSLLINGQPVRERGLLEPGASVTGDDFSLALEAVTR
jgi:tetratricopeptide (TPR) repeat protein